MHPHQKLDPVVHGVSNPLTPRHGSEIRWPGAGRRIGALLLCGIAAAVFISKPFVSKHASAQTVSAQEDASRLETPEAQELNRWLNERTDREILMIDQILSQRKHPKLSEQEVIDFGMLNSVMIHRLYKQGESPVERERSMRTQDRILNPEHYNAELRSQMTPLEVEHEKAAMDAFFNAFPQTPPSPSPRISIPTSDEGSGQ